MINLEDPRTLAYILIGGVFLLGFIIGFIIGYFIGKRNKKKKNQEQNIPDIQEITQVQDFISPISLLPTIPETQSQIPQIPQQIPQERYIPIKTELPKEKIEKQPEPLKMEKWVTYDEPVKQNVQLYQEVTEKKKPGRKAVKKWKKKNYTHKKNLNWMDMYI